MNSYEWIILCLPQGKISLSSFFIYSEHDICHDVFVVLEVDGIFKILVFSSGSIEVFSLIAFSQTIESVIYRFVYRQAVKL